MAPVTRKRNVVARMSTSPMPTALQLRARQPIFTNVMTELNVSHKKACMLCSKTQISEKLYGPLYQFNDVVVHYFCILLSSRAAQNGTDREGIWGFLLKDIKEEIIRGSKEICFYCNKKGATISCCGKKCRKQFHLPCGLKNGSMHQYFQYFKSFCQNHRLPQIIDVSELQNAVTPTLCAICKDNVQPTPLPTTLWAPCCKHNTWFHRECVQDLALSAGYFFKCPLCNNVDKFKGRMLEQGIYIPSRDASWETVPGAFAELAERHNICNAVNCQCPHQDKRKFNEEFGSWKLMLCYICGSNGTHCLCSGVKCDQVWCCSTCQAIADKKGESELPDNGNCSGNSVFVFGAGVSSQNTDVFQRQNSEIILNETQAQSFDDPILISDDSNDGSVEPIIDVEPPNTHLQVVQTRQIRLPIITSYRSLSTSSTRNHLNRRFSVSTNQSMCINLVSDDDDSEYE